MSDILYSTVYKVNKPQIIFEGKVNEAPHQEEPQNNNDGVSDVLDNIASNIPNEEIVINESSVDSSNIVISNPMLPTFNETSRDTIININEPTVVVEETVSETEKDVLELTQELKLELSSESEVDRITNEFLTPQETNSLVIDRKEIGVTIDSDKYDALFGPEERGLLNLTFNDASTYMTVLDYLESEDVLSYIPFDSNVKLDNGEVLTGVEFIKTLLIPYLQKCGYHQINDAIQIMGAEVEKKKEEKQSFFKRLFK